MATGDPLRSTKAIVAAALGFVAPGAAYLVGVAGDGITRGEWVVGALICIAGSVAIGGAVHQVENKPK